MSTIYLCSTDPSAGKTLLAIGLARQLAKLGYSVGYIKPVAASGHGDVQLMKGLLSLSEPDNLIGPLDLGAAEAGSGLSARVEQAYRQVAQGKDVVLAEGGGNLNEGAQVGLSAAQVATKLEAAVVLVVKYIGEATIDSVLVSKRSLGELLSGVVVNNVPAAQESLASTTVVPALEGRQVKVLGVLPQDPVLLAPTVKELVEVLGAEVLCCEDQVGRLVESLLIGAISYEGSSAYFARKRNKAVLSPANRPDMQLWALAGPLSCLIITGRYNPDPTVLANAKAKGVPVVRSDKDSVATVEAMQELFVKGSVGQPDKLVRIDALLSGRLDFHSVFSALQLPRRAG